LEDGLKVAADTYVDVNIHNAENAAILERLAQLPVNCAQSADCLDKARCVFEAQGIFDSAMIDDQIKKLKSYDQAEADAAMHNDVKMQKIVNRYFHCG
jgi:glutamine synthetase